MTDLAAVKKSQQVMWAGGDYATIGARILIASELLCEAADLRAGQKVLDVGTGTGNTALAAARRFCEVTGIDYVPAWLERARERARLEGLEAAFVEGDAEAIPFPDASFDVVLSTYGSMFAPDQERTAREMLRVCRAGGKIGMANWTPDGFSGQMFRVTARYIPPPPGLKPASRWGTEAGVRELFGDGIASLRVARRELVFRFRSARHRTEFFRAHFGPTIKAFEALDAARQEEFTRELEALAERFNRSGDGTLVLPSEYLEVVAVRR